LAVSWIDKSGLLAFWENRLIFVWATACQALTPLNTINGCFEPGLEESGIYCVVEKKRRKKQARVKHILDE